MAILAGHELVHCSQRAGESRPVEFRPTHDYNLNLTSPSVCTFESGNRRVTCFYICPEVVSVNTANLPLPRTSLLDVTCRDHKRHDGFSRST